METQVKHFEFYSHDLLTWESPEGKRYVSIAHMCKAIGLRVQKQRDRIQQHPLFQSHTLRFRLEPQNKVGGRSQDVLGLDIEYVMAWLGNINPNAVRDTIRETLLIFQEQCASALHDFWTKGYARNPHADLGDFDPIEETLKQVLAQHREIKAIERQTKALEEEQSQVKEQLNTISAEFESTTINHEQRLRRVEAQQGPPGYMTALGFCRTHQIGNPEAPRILGSSASQMARVQGVHKVMVPDPRWGEVGSYPRELLYECALRHGLLSQ